MLANILAVLLVLGSFTFYMVAFFYPEVNRRNDWLWSALGLFYAIVLWFSASQITGVVLLGQLAAVSLLLGLGWQTLTVRREKTPVYQQTPVVITPEVVSGWAKNKLNQLRIAPPEAVPVQLEKRTLKEFSTDRPDPRRRPVYEYEFVEDGILTQRSLLPATEAQAIAQSIDDSEATEELNDTDPPAAVAEVLLVETPELETSEPEASEPETPALETPPLESLDLNEPDFNKKASELEIPDYDGLQPAAVSQAEPVEDIDEVDGVDDWGDEVQTQTTDRQTTDRQTADRQTAQKPAGKSKPSFLTMPLVLVGWVKDVVSSFTQPKPSKPVIDIPRRDPSIRITQAQAQTTDSVDNQARNRSDSWPEEILEERPEEQPEEWPEDSNWDD